MDEYSTFENFEIGTNSLPDVEEAQYESLEKSYLKVSLIGNIIFWLIVIVAAVIFLLFNPLTYPEFFNNIGIGVLSLMIVFSFYVTIKGYYRKAYVLREKDMVYKSGLFWRSLTSVPFNRVQHCEVKQGPIERYFNLGQLSVFTAGGSQSDLHISGLNFDNANRLRQYILSQSAHDEEE